MDVSWVKSLGRGMAGLSVDRSDNHMAARIAARYDGCVCGRDCVSRRALMRPVLHRELHGGVVLAWLVGCVARPLQLLFNHDITQALAAGAGVLYTVWAGALGHGGCWLSTHRGDALRPPFFNRSSGVADLPGFAGRTFAPRYPWRAVIVWVILQCSLGSAEPTALGSTQGVTDQCAVAITPL